MPKSRNRGVQNSFDFSAEFLKALPPLERVDKLKKSSQQPSYLCFGEPIPLQHRKNDLDKIYNLSSSSDCDNVSDYDILSFGKSSSSSISWSDEFDVEATQRVKNELERVERILQGKEPIPHYYNQDEYKQWMKTFPQLSILGYKEDSISENCDKDSTSSEIKKVNSIKFAVIEDAYHASSKVNGDGYKEPELHQKLINKSRNMQNPTRQFDNILRISPVLLQEPVSRSFYLSTRQQSSQSVLKSDKRASKWMHEEPQDYTSLPYITMGSAKVKPNKVLNKTLNSSKTRTSSKASQFKNYISLPPIKTINIPSSAQYRSISTTPRKVYNEQSAISAHIDSLTRRRKVTQNKLESIHNLIGYPK